MQSKLYAIIAAVALMLMPSLASAVTIVNCQPCTVSSTTNLVCPKPTGLIVGQLLWANMVQTQSSGQTKPAGWTNVGGEAPGGSGICGQSISNGPGFWYADYKVATSTEVAASSFAFTWGSGFADAGVLCALDSVGYSGGSPIDNNTVSCTSNGFSPSTTPTTTSLTTTVNNSQVFIWYNASFQLGASTITGPGGATQEYQASNGWLGDFLQATAGSTGTQAGTQTQNVQWNAGIYAILTGSPVGGVTAQWPFP